MNLFFKFLAVSKFWNFKTLLKARNWIEHCVEYQLRKCLFNRENNLRTTISHRFAHQKCKKLNNLSQVGALLCLVLKHHEAISLITSKSYESPFRIWIHIQRALLIKNRSLNCISQAGHRGRCIMRLSLAILLGDWYARCSRSWWFEIVLPSMWS